MVFNEPLSAAGEEWARGAVADSLQVAAEWNVLRGHMQYARKYDNLELVGLRDGSSMNLPITPGYYLDQEAFYGGDETALTVLIHESMHDLNRLGVGHEGNGLNEAEIILRFPRAMATVTMLPSRAFVGSSKPRRLTLANSGR